MNDEEDRVRHEAMRSHAQEQMDNKDNPFLRGLGAGLSGSPAGQAMAQGVPPATAETLNQAPPPATPPAPAGAVPPVLPAGMAKPPAAPPQGQPGQPGQPWMVSPKQYTEQSAANTEAANRAMDTRIESNRQQQELIHGGAVEMKNSAEKMAAADMNREADIDAMKAASVKHQEARAKALEEQTARAAAMHTDPNKWYNDVGTGGTIAAALSIAAGAFAAGMPHGSGHNTALDIINDAVNKDIAAQQGKIDQAWKDADYQGEANDKAYAKEQHEINAKLDAKQVALTNATKQAQMVQAATADQGKAAALGDVIGALQGEKAKAAQQQADLIFQVSQKERAAAASQASAAATAEKKQAEWERDYAAKAAADPSAQLSDEAKARGMTLEEAALHQARAIYTADSAHAGFIRREKPEGASKADKDAARDAKTNEAIASYGNMGVLASQSATIGNRILSKLPSWLAPGANMAQDEVDAYNNLAIPQALKATGARMTPEQLKEQQAELQIHPGMSDEQRAERIKTLVKLAGVGAAIKLGRGSSQDDGAP